MSKIVLLLSTLACFAGSAFAQMYAGPNQATLSFTGSSETISFETSAMTGRYTPESRQLVLMAKTGALPLQASQEDQELFNEIFLPSTNPLLKITIDLSSLDSEEQSGSFPAQILWNDVVSEQMLDLSIVQNQEAITFDVTANLSLESFQIVIPGTYTDRFSNECSLMMTGATLHRR